MKDKKNVFIIGDSYSTYRGYNPEGYNCYYSDERTAEPVVRGVDKTWWRILARERDLNIVLNDSFSGSTVCNTVRKVLTVESSFVSRIDKYIESGFFAENKIDLALIFGGTNDSWIDAPVGSLKYSDFTADELKCVLPAFCYLVSKLKEVTAEVVVIVNSNLKEEITCGFTEACETLGVKCLRLDKIDKQNGHPTESGMEEIAAQVSKALK